MAEFKGTKKPWRTSKDFREVTTSKIGVLEGSKKICTMASYCKTDDEVEANAKLIAAAPDLLNACLKVIKGGYGCGPSVEYMDSLKKECELAIKKATE